jgi:polar amino acid transport system permease protein
MYTWDFSIIYEYRWVFLHGLGITVALTAAIIVGGLAVGMTAAICLLSPFRLLRLVSLCFIEVFRCTPILVQLIWFYYALPIISGIDLSPVTASLIALSCYGGSFYAEIIRGGIVSLDPGQTEAAQALGMRPSLVMRRIVLPQALRRMLPALMNQSILQFKNTSLVSVVAVPDLVYQGQMVAHDSYRPLETYTAVAIGYFAILFPLTLFVRYRERKSKEAR